MSKEGRGLQTQNGELKSADTKGKIRAALKGRQRPQEVLNKKLATKKAKH